MSNRGYSEGPAGVVLRATVSVAIVALFAAVGAAGGAVAAGKVKRQYTAVVNVRSSVADGSCVFFSCPTLSAGPSGIPYVLDQVNLIAGSALASSVRDSLPNTISHPSVRALQENVRAREVGGSTTIVIAYSDPSPTRASLIAKTFARAYVDHANTVAVNAIDPIRRSLTSRLAGAPKSQRGALQVEVDRVAVAETAYKNGVGPNGAALYGDTPVVERGGFSRSVWMLLGAAIGGLVGLAVVAMTAIVRSNRAPAQAAVTREREPIGDLTTSSTS